MQHVLYAVVAEFLLGLIPAVKIYKRSRKERAKQSHISDDKTSYPEATELLAQLEDFSAELDILQLMSESSQREGFRR